MRDCVCCWRLMVASLVAALWVACLMSPVACRTSRPAAEFRARPESGDNSAQAAEPTQLTLLARQLGSADRLTREQAMVHVRRLSLDQQQVVVTEVERHGVRIEPSLSREMALMASAKAPRLAARWWAVRPNAPFSQAEREERLLNTIDMLMAAQEWEAALELCVIRLVGDYSPRLERELAARRSRMEEPMDNRGSR